MDTRPIALSAVGGSALSALCRRFHVQRLDLSGSAADGRFDPVGMISDKAAKYIQDARRAIEPVIRFTTGCDRDGYLADEMLRFVVERQFEIIGEVFDLRRAEPGLADTIPDLPRIVAFRNMLIHGYAAVDERLAWGMVEGKLPQLLAHLTDLLD